MPPQTNLLTPLVSGLQLREGHVVLSVEGTGLQASSLRLEAGRANDGDWHHAQLALGASGGPGHAILSLDYGQQRVEGNLGPRLHGLHLSNITVGGTQGAAGGVARGFRGCLQVSVWFWGERGPLHLRSILLLSQHYPLLLPGCKGQ